MKFTPAKTYDGLLRQAKAMQSLVRSLEKELLFYRTKPSFANDATLYQRLQQQIDSEREVNEMLTNELDKLSQSNQKS